MNQNQSCRKSVNKDYPATRSKSLESNRGRRQQTSCNRTITPIQEESMNDCEPQVFEEEQDCRFNDQEPRYDPKELRDAVRILSPFVRLIADTNNPYARLVAREVCKTFYHLFHFNVHPIDLMKSIDWKPKEQRNVQMWSEIWLYIPENPLKEWVSLRSAEREDNLIELNDNCGSSHLQDMSNNQQYPINKRPDVSNCNIQRNSRSPEPNQCTRNLNYDINEQARHTAYNRYASDTYPDLENIGFPDDEIEHQFAGSDNPMSLTRNSNTKFQIISSARRNTGGQKINDTELNIKNTFDRITNSKRQLEQLVEAAGKTCCVSSNDTIVENEITNYSLKYPLTKRQTAGNDIYLPYCKPGCSTDPNPIIIHNTENSNQYDYYRRTGNTPSPRRTQSDFNMRRPLPRSPVEPEIRINALDNTMMSEELSCSDSDSFNSVKDLNINQIGNNANVVASAFTNLTLAQKELKKKKEAFKKLTQNCLNYASNPLEVDPPSADCSPCSKNVLRAVCQTSPKVMKSFDDDEWNDNAFKDRDFIRILPFYESIHHQLEYVSNKQREYGINMLDDIMSTMYYIHYDLGDPRLKNELLIEHVKLITRNTWETYFYGGVKRMPEIPQPPQPCCSIPQKSSPKQCPRQPLSRQSSPREISPRQPSPSCPKQAGPRRSSSRQLSPSCPKRSISRPPSPKNTCAKQPITKPSQSRPCSAKQSCPNKKPIDSNRRPRATSCRRTENVSQQMQNPSTECRGNFLRRSQPSGAPKKWAPKLKPVERPKEAKMFKAKPLPKFVRDRLDSRDENC